MVIHGHIREGCVCISGPLADAGHKVVAQVLDYIHARLQAAGQGFHGCVSFRLEIESDGTVARAVRLSDRVYRTSAEASDPLRMVSDLTAFLGRAQRLIPSVIQDVQIVFTLKAQGQTAQTVNV